jgi:hypothetical protein
MLPTQAAAKFNFHPLARAAAAAAIALLFFIEQA